MVAVKRIQSCYPEAVKKDKHDQENTKRLKKCKAHIVSGLGSETAENEILGKLYSLGLLLLLGQAKSRDKKKKKK